MAQAAALASMRYAEMHREIARKLSGRVEKDLGELCRRRRVHRGTRGYEEVYWKLARRYQGHVCQLFFYELKHIDLKTQEESFLWDISIIKWHIKRVEYIDFYQNEWLCTISLISARPMLIFSIRPKWGRRWCRAPHFVKKLPVDIQQKIEAVWAGYKEGEDCKKQKEATRAILDTITEEQWKECRPRGGRGPFRPPTPPPLVESTTFPLL